MVVDAVVQAALFVRLAHESDVDRLVVFFAACFPCRCSRSCDARIHRLAKGTLDEHVRILLPFAIIYVLGADYTPFGGLNGFVGGGSSRLLALVCPRGILARAARGILANGFLRIVVVSMGWPVLARTYPVRRAVLQAIRAVHSPVCSADPFDVRVITYVVRVAPDLRLGGVLCYRG